jgi:hypothetical protein
MRGEVENAQAELDRKTLEAFVVENEDLERLEAVLGQFNIFEATGVVQQEVRHSDFLAYLLDPRGNHGLRDAFAKRLLQKALASNDSALAVSPIDLDLWDLSQARVLREEHRISWATRKTSATCRITCIDRGRLLILLQ